jgi:peroxiredoxin
VTLSTLRSLAWPGATILAALLVVVLATQKRALERRVEDLTTRVNDPYPGFVVPEVTAETMAGDPVVLGLPDSGSLQLLFLFSTGCNQCEASLPAWSALYTAFDTDPRIDVIGVSLDSAHVTRTYAADHGLAFPAVTMTDRRMQVLWRARLLPQTRLIDALGRVQYVRLGRLTALEAIDSVRAATVTQLAFAREAEGDTVIQFGIGPSPGTQR